VSLTGVPLILLAVLATVAAGFVTVWCWSRFGRQRMLVRTVGVLLSEALLVLSAGLIANRVDQFYPSWAALAGHTGAAATTVSRAAGRLDRTLHAGGAEIVPWQPSGATSWHLIGHASLVVPAGYASRRTTTFPVVLDLAGPHSAGDTVTVHLSPSAKTTAAALASLPAYLDRDVRVTTRGWAIVASMKDAVFAAELVKSAPGRFVALVLVGEGRPRPCGIAMAVVRRRAAGVPLPPGTTVLTGSGAQAWTVATDWAAGQTSPPLAASVQLPAEGVPSHRQATS